MFLLTIYLPWLLNMLPYSYRALTCDAALPTYSAFMISVRQASDLPPASFRFPVTQDTLALGYILPAVGRIRDFHPLKHAPAGRTSKQELRICSSCFDTAKAYKPGSVLTAIYLAPQLPVGSSRLLGTVGRTYCPSTALLRDRVYIVKPMLPWAGCALTAPFHPYPAWQGGISLLHLS